ncbi:MAG: hypothetical protein U0610_10260 [bacterium]
MAESEPKPPAKKDKGAAYDSWKATNAAPTAGSQQAKGTLKGRFTAMVDRFIRKFNTDKGWYDE